MSNRTAPLALLAGAALAALVAMSGRGGGTGPGPGPGPGPAPSGGPVGEAIVAAAKPCVGLSYSTAQTPYLLACYPGDVTASGAPDANAIQMGREHSSCLLFARGMYARAGVDGRITWKGKTIDALREPYAHFLGQIETLLYELAKQRGALDPGGKGGPIEPGDIVVIGMGGSKPKDPEEYAKWEKEWGGIAHGSVVVGVSGTGIHTVDGGQPDSGTGHSSAIDERTRTIHTDGSGRLWLDDRRINYVIKASAMNQWH